MYTYLITAALIAIASACLFRHKIKNGNVQLIVLLVIIVGAVIATVTVNQFRKDSLETKLFTRDSTPMAYQTVGHDTLYYQETSINQNGKVIRQQLVSKTRPTTGTYSGKLNPIKSLIVYKDNKLVWAYGTKEDEKDSISVFDTIKLNSGRFNLKDYFGIGYIGDKWTSSLSLPWKLTYSTYRIDKTDLMPIINKNPEILNKWIIIDAEGNRAIYNKTK